MVLVLSACIAILIGLASSRCPDDQQCYSMKKNLEEQNYIGLMTDINILCECPDDWSYVDSVKGCYKVQNIPLSWDDAGQECQQLHPKAHLVVINDAAEQSAIESLIKADRNDACILKGHGYNYWIAGQRVDPTTESEFIWRVGTEEYPMTYEHWRIREPNYGDSNEHCAHLWGKFHNYWNDFVCTEELCAVCEIDM